MTMKTSPLHIEDYLKTDEDIKEFLKELYNTGTYFDFIHGLVTVFKANKKKFSFNKFLPFIIISLVGFSTVASATLMNSSIYANCQNQTACDAAQNGTYAGGGATAGAVTLAVISTSGPAGLATIGAAVGGGMAAGAITVIAAPVVAAAAIGGAVYWLFSDDETE